MTYRIGDASFTRDGRPSVVTNRNRDTGIVTVEKRGENFEKTRRVGYINGLNKDQRENFNEVVKEVREKDTPRERLNLLQEKINEVKDDPKKVTLKRYLESELTYLMNSTGVKPKDYKIDADQLVR